ncbi:MAG TPA: hypothetical protein VGX23_02630 [Actinocrinis sp.]|nr:hypothetical protein [Actinocrinis sp.]
MRATYDVGGSDREFQFEDLLDFGNTRVQYDIRPYTHENIQSLALRVGMDALWVIEALADEDWRTDSRNP